MSTEPAQRMDQDEQQLADLGYKQELKRGWSAFSNFAISFTIISVLAGTFTTFGQAWNNGGPIAASIGWPVVCALVLLVALSMAELTSAYPTAGGPYWWAHKLGGKGWSWFTGWFNIVGLVGIVASVGYGAAIFLNALLGLYGVDFVFTETINNSTFDGGSTESAFFWIYVLPLGFLLTMYTQTGYDASAHTAEETRGAAISAARGVWRSVFFSALIGWLVLLAFLFAANDVGAINDEAGFSIGIFTSALDPWAAKMVVLIATIGQLFCGMACLTSASRTWYAFARDRGIPGWPLWRRLNHHRVPSYAVLAVAAAALIITLPALGGNDDGAPFAFIAVVAITTVGLYIAYAIPIYLRLRAGDSFEPGPWTLGRKYRVINTAAVTWVAISVIIFFLPFVPEGVPWNDGFDWTSFNYAPIVAVVGAIVGVWYLVSARHKYAGPVSTLDTDEEGRVIEPGPASGGN